ncbi:MAG: ribosome-associated translation inhibitor RaiA [Chloroflexi bacterium]|nr:ribosome-associated translation inhibitor RaiA [Chloroflexota bacterium]
MELTITARGFDLTDSVDTYARKRLSKLDRRLRFSVPARLVVRHEKARRPDERFIAEITAELKGTILRGEERGETLHAAIDQVTDVLDRQIRRYKTKRIRRGDGLSELEERVVAQLADVEDPEPETLEDGRLVREKRHRVTRMTVTEAAAQMDLLGHDFYMFTNADSGEANVVYRRHDGDYGLIIPEV